jgi:hypothetical protein
MAYDERLAARIREQVADSANLSEQKMVAGSRF